MATRRFAMAILSALTIFAGCTGKSESPGRPTVAVSILPLKYFVERIADSAVLVNVLVPPGSSPEMFEPTPGQLVEFSQSDIYFAIGLLDFEQGLEPKLRNGHGAKYVNLSAGAGLMEGSCAHGEEHGGHSHHHGVDPHIWASAVEARHIAKAILHSLSDVYPAHRERFALNHARFAAEIDSLDAQIRTILASSGAKAFLIYHPALGYFARDYGITQMSIEEEGKSPSAKGMLSVIRRSKALGIRSVLLQGQFDTHSSQAIAREIGGTVVRVDPLAEDWPQAMLQIANAVAGQ